MRLIYDIFAVFLMIAMVLLFILFVYLWIAYFGGYPPFEPDLEENAVQQILQLAGGAL